MLVNLHTHTPRCQHAVGADEEYVTEAIDRGLKILGFSDHTPHFYPNGHISSVRMTPDMLPEYVQSIHNLQKKYADRITIHLGVEAEYYPPLFPDTLAILRDNGVEYMLLGQHKLYDQNIHCGDPTADETVLQTYCDQVIEAMQMGLFTYLAHPDFIKFMGDDSVFNKHMSRLCKEAKSCNIPLEINMLGLRQGRNYPSDRFFRLVAEEGCKVVIGSDAHAPEQVYLPENYGQALDIVKQFDLDLIKEPKIIRI